MAICNPTIGGYPFGEKNIRISFGRVPAGLYHTGSRSRPSSGGAVSPGRVDHYPHRNGSHSDHGKFEGNLSRRQDVDER